MNNRCPAPQNHDWIFLKAALGNRRNPLDELFFFAHTLISASGFPAASAFM